MIQCRTGPAPVVMINPLPADPPEAVPGHIDQMLQAFTPHRPNGLLVRQRVSVILALPMVGDKRLEALDEIPDEAGEPVERLWKLQRRLRALFPEAGRP